VAVLQSLDKTSLNTNARRSNHFGLKGCEYCCQFHEHLLAAFTLPKAQKDTDDLTVSFAHLVSTWVKAARKPRVSTSPKFYDWLLHRQLMFH
jgi:hypothetical protein